MIKSMTSYAASIKQDKWGTINWEIRTVNHRYLDCNFRIPDSFRQIESNLREILRTKLSRGRVDCYLKFRPGENVCKQLALNTQLLKQIQTAVKNIDQQYTYPLSPINPLQLLNWPNIIQSEDYMFDFLQEKIIAQFNKTLNEAVNARKREGTALKNIILQKLQTISKEISKIKKHLPKSLKDQQDKILSYFKNAQTMLDPSRLEQEMILFAQKIDITEELDRLEAHIHEIKNTLRNGDVVGKRLDFLTQELNREANTIASKSTSKNITHIAVELKVIIEQIREQVQNIE